MQSATILERLVYRYEVLHDRRDALLLGLGLDAVDGGTALDVKRDARASQQLYRDAGAW